MLFYISAKDMALTFIYYILKIYCYTKFQHPILSGANITLLKCWYCLQQGKSMKVRNPAVT